MKRLGALIPAGLWLAGLLSCVAAHAELRFTDDRGATLRLAHPAQRIVSLAPHVTELLFAAGAGERVVGAVAYSDHPQAAARLPRVGDAHGLDLERILGLKPDLLIAWDAGNSARQLQLLLSLGVPVYHHDAQRIGQVAQALETFGRLAGTEATARAAAQAFRKRLSALHERFAQRPPVSVFYQVWPAPLLTVNGRDAISDLITHCGGRNVFAAMPMRVPQPSREAVLEANPEVMIAAGAADAWRTEFGAWLAWPQLQAVAHGNLVMVPPEHITRPTPRLLDGMQAVCESLEAARAKR